MQAILYRGVILLEGDRFAEAEANFRAARILYEGAGHAGAAQAGMDEATAAIRGGSPDRACPVLQQALQAARSNGDVFIQSQAILPSIELANVYGERDRAARWLGHFLYSFAELGMQLHGSSKVVIDRITAQLEDGLGADAYQKAREAGEHLDPPAAIAEVEAWLTEQVARRKAEARAEASGIT
jgi:hypothetical protein